MLDKLFKINQTLFVFGFLIGAIIFLSSFLVVHYSLAVDDNINETSCVNYIADCDNNQTSCSYFNFDWTSAGYPGGAGNASCCGDDSAEYYSDGQNNLGEAGCCSSSGEYFLSCHATSNNFCLNGEGSDLSDSVCTTDDRACIYNGTVYPEFSLVDVVDDSNDLEWCHGGAIASVNGEGGNAWDDQDYVIFDGNNYIAGYCQHTPLVGNCDNAGPNGTCDDSDNNPDDGYCCGDDPDENYVSTDCDGNSVSFCCPDSAPYVQNGKCVISCIYGPVTGLKVTQNYYDEDSGQYFVQWDWDNFTNYNPSCVAPDCYVGYHLEDEDGDTFYPCSGNFTYTNNSYLTSTDYNITCMDNCTYNGSDCVRFGSNEEHCLRVYPVITDSGGTRQNIGPPSDLICINTAVCGDNTYDVTDYDDSQANCDSVGYFYFQGCGHPDSSWDLSPNGDASSSCWQGMCCGDDSGEYALVYSSCGADNAPPYSECSCLSDNVIKACCDNGTDCVGYFGATEGQCFNFNEVANIVSDHKWICKENGVWEDCDSNYADCGDAVCGSASGVYAGEPSVGMYSDTVTLECCGDDTGEYYAELCPGVSSVERKCCNESGDKIDQDGNCVSSCPAVNQAPTISLSSPSNGATCINESGITLTWDGNDPDSGPNPLEYHLYISIDQDAVNNFDASAYWTTVTSESYDYADPLGYNTTYYWAVIADDGDLQTASEVWSFTTQVCDSSQACCQADGCSFIGDGGQPRGYSDVYSCDGDPDCGGSCDIQVDPDYYCQDNDGSVYQTSVSTGVTCDACEEWNGADGCDLCVTSECGTNYPCSTEQCDLYDPDGTGPVGQQAYYQTRQANCNSCSCLPWGAYESCQDSYNNCTGANQVECYQGVGCNTANNACYCEAGYDPDGAGGCVSDGTYPIVDFDWCLSTQANTLQFTSTVSGGSGVYTSYEWDFGDGSCTGPSPADECDDINPIHTYSTTATYQVSLVVTDSDSHQGEKIHTVDLSTAPDCPTSFVFNSVTAQSSTSLVLEWDYSKGNPTYEIYRDGSQITGATYVCGSETCTYTDTGLQPGTQYSYYIIARPSGSYNSTIDPVCDGATEAPCPLSATTKSDVGGLNVYSDSCGKIKIQWNDLGEDYTYYIYRNLESAESIEASDLLISIDRSHCSGGTCVYEDESIIPEKIYYYKITSYSAATGESSLDDADSGSAFSYCYRAPVWGEM